MAFIAFFEQKKLAGALVRKEILAENFVAHPRHFSIFAVPIQIYR